MGLILPRTWLGSTWSCLVLVKNDQKNIFEAQGLPAAGDWACECGTWLQQHSISHFFGTTCIIFEIMRLFSSSLVWKHCQVSGEMTRPAIFGRSRHSHDLQPLIFSTMMMMVMAVAMVAILPPKSHLLHDEEENHRHHQLSQFGRNESRDLQHRRD